MPNHSDNMAGTAGKNELNPYHAVVADSSNHPAWLLHIQVHACTALSTSHLSRSQSECQAMYRSRVGRRHGA
jgi:hypothetical protein